MGKLFAILVAMGLSASVCGTSVSQATAFDEAAFLEEIRPTVECLNDCALEMFGAEVDFDTAYHAAYENEAAYDNGRGEVAILYLPGEEEKLSEYFIVDPTISDYYPVANFKTNEDVREYLRGYMSDELVEKNFPRNVREFLEYEGDLYLRRGSRGYGAVTCNLDSLRYLVGKGGKQYATVDFLLFNEYDYTEILEFTKTETGWLLTDEIVQE